MHLGAHKTASTHLQQTLQANREALARGGLLFLGPPDLRGAGSLRLGAIAAGVGPDQIAHLRRQVRKAGRVLISEENILGVAHEPGMLRERRFYPQAGARLARVLDAAQSGQAALFLAVRDPASFLVSAYGQRLLSGHGERFETFLQGAEPAALRWSELVERILSVSGVVRCTVWCYEEWPGIAPRVMEAMLGELAQVVPVPARRVAHPGLSKTAHAEVMAALDEGRFGPHAARAARERFPKGPDWPAFEPWDAARIEESAAAFAEDLRRIEVLPGVRLLRSAPGRG